MPVLVSEVASMVVSRWLHAVFAADVTLLGLVPLASIHWQTVPELAPVPHLLYQHIATTDTRTLGNRAAMQRTHWLLKAVDLSPNFQRIEPIYKRAHALIDTARFQQVFHGGVSVGWVLGCARETEIVLTPLVGDQYEAHLGGTYLIDVEVAAAVA